VVYHGKNAAGHGKTKSIHPQNLQTVLQDGKLKMLSGLQQENAVIARFPQEAAYVQFPAQ
jgi:hypothetical protein